MRDRGSGTGATILESGGTQASGGFPRRQSVQAGAWSATAARRDASSVAA